ncbi:MAG: HAMP domain-containing histidine kinase [Magnetococcales bacterium]|nr:HAMP domain-containing histidine kinase [Magnetococcales bacterium]
MLEHHALLVECAKREDPLIDQVLSLILEQKATLAEKRISDALLVELVRQLVESERQLSEHREYLLTIKEVLERQNQELIEADRLKQDVELISRHDMKSPLNGLIGYSDLLLESGTLSPEHQNYVRMMRKAGVTVLHMVNLSLGLYRMEQGSYRLEAEDIDLIPVIRGIRDDSQALISGHLLKVVIRIRNGGGSDAFFVRAEEVLCYSMLANLIKNALEASPEGAWVTIELSVGDDGMGVIEIGNQGMVPEKIRDRFFEKYVTIGKNAGTGLGTYSARLIVETLGGTIRMESSADRGTRITVTLPLAERTRRDHGTWSRLRSDDAERIGPGGESPGEMESGSVSGFPDAVSQRMERLQKALEDRRLDDVVREIIWLRGAASEVGAGRVASQAVRLQGIVEMEAWDEAHAAFWRLEAIVQKAVATLRGRDGGAT